MASPSPLDFYKQRMRSVDRRRFLRPMSSGEIIDLATRCYQVLAKPVLRLTILPMLFCYAGLIFLQTFILPQLFETRSEAVSGQVAEVMIAYCIALVVALPLFVVGLAYSSGLTVRLVSDFILGNEVDIEKAKIAAATSGKAMIKLLYGVFFRAAGIILLAGLCLVASAYLESLGLQENVIFLLASMASIGGLLIGILAIPIVLNMYALVPQAAVMEGLAGKDAFQRSRALMKSVRYHGNASSTTVGTWIVCFFVFLGLNLGFGAILELINFSTTIQSALQLGSFSTVLVSALEMLPTFLALWLIAPIWSTATTILYFDRRVRLEALDIWLLADDVLKSDRKTVLLS